MSHPLDIFLLQGRAAGAGIGCRSLLAKTESVAIVGTDARVVEIEVHVPRAGLPSFSVVGLPTPSVRESEHRCRSALVASGSSWPSGRIVVNIAPGALRKEGTHYDLPLALAILAADEVIPAARLRDLVVMGELALDGSLRPVRGVLAGAIAARQRERACLICPRGNSAEAAIVEGIEVIAVSTLKECLDYLKGEHQPQPVEPVEQAPPEFEDLAEVRGHPQAKEALEIAAAGAHNLLLCGSPGSGKTMLARRLPGILPEMSLDEAFEVTRIRSVAGLLPERASLVTTRPFRVPHHHVSLAGLIGGGTGLARPGEVTLAHNGCLFLDELTLYSKAVLESLRAPLEDKVVRIARSGGSVTYPCRFSLIAAMNPCPCGYEGDLRRACKCEEYRKENYRARLSGPLLDRFDMQVAMQRLTGKELMSAPDGEDSVTVRGRVEAARAVQARRYGSSLATNASVSTRVLRDEIALSVEADGFARRAVDQSLLTGRGLDRLMRVARTIADLDGLPMVDEVHIGRALQLRTDVAAPVMA